MEQTYKVIKEAVSYYIDRADRLRLPEECELAEEIADKIWHLEEAMDILRSLHPNET